MQCDKYVSMSSRFNGVSCVTFVQINLCLQIGGLYKSSKVVYPKLHLAVIEQTQHVFSNSGWDALSLSIAAWKSVNRVFNLAVTRIQPCILAKRSSAAAFQVDLSAAKMEA